MLDLSKYQSIGDSLKDAVEVFADEICLIEADRERENLRLTYRVFRDRTMPVAKALQDAGFAAGDLAAIIMTNQSKWLISAYAIFYAGGVLVPLDYKLTADEQWQLLKHSGARVLITEYPIWRQLSAAKGRAEATALQMVIVTEAPIDTDLLGGVRWEIPSTNTGEAEFRSRTRSDTPRIVYSSETG